jgi:hypothetical protein
MRQSKLPINYTLEAYIPCSRQELLDRCLAEGRLAETDAAQWRAFCEMLAALYHFFYHQRLETLKTSFAPFNPDRPVAHAALQDETTRDAHEERFVTTVTQVLTEANYHQLTPGMLQAALGHWAKRC